MMMMIIMGSVLVDMIVLLLSVLRNILFELESCEEVR